MSGEYWPSDRRVSYEHLTHARRHHAAREASYAMLAYLGVPRIPSIDHEDIELELDPPSFIASIQDPRHAPHSEGLVIVELGSGTGLIAARIAPYLRDCHDVMVATDLPEICGLLRKNLHNYSTVEVHPLSWGNHQEALSIASTLGLGTTRHLSHILCSDLVRFDHYIATHHPRTNRSLVGVFSFPSRPVASHASAPHIGTHRFRLRSTTHGDHLLQDTQSCEGDSILGRLRAVVHLRSRVGQTQNAIERQRLWFERLTMDALCSCCRARRLLCVHFSETARVEGMDHPGEGRRLARRGWRVGKSGEEVGRHIRDTVADVTGCNGRLITQTTCRPWSRTTNVHYSALGRGEAAMLAGTVVRSSTRNTRKYTG